MRSSAAAALLLGAIALISCCFSATRATVSRSSAGPGDRCEFPDGAVGRCEEIQGCQGDGDVMKRGDTIVTCAPNAVDGIHVCCRRPRKVAEMMCSAWRPYWSGLTKDGGTTCVTQHNLISGGEDAGLGEFPNIVLVAKGTAREFKAICGGTLITPMFVLTAAHCIKRLAPGESRWVVLGEHDRKTTSETFLDRLDRGPLPQGLTGNNNTREDDGMVPVEQTIEVEHSFVYPDYLKNYHDIGLLRLRSPATLTSRVLPSCLPFEQLRPQEGATLFTVAGWGDLEYNTQQGSQILQMAVIKKLDSNWCYKEDFAHLPFAALPLGVTTDMICAGDEGKDACGGDSGGPLMLDPPSPVVGGGSCEPRQVVGVVAFGIGCRRIGIYTRTYSYLDWITGIVATKMLPPA